MENFDAIILGGGPAALAVADKYINNRKNGKVMLFDEVTIQRGAYMKGIKSVNPIVPKLPAISPSNLDHYKLITSTIKSLEATMAKSFAGSYPFKGNSTMGCRLCNKEELELLKNIPGLELKCSKVMSGNINQFAVDYVGEELKDLKPFTFQEKIWNMGDYIKIKFNEIPAENVRFVNYVSYKEENDGVVLNVTDADNKSYTVKTKKLLVCRGIGNIEFEQQICSIMSLKSKSFGFKVLNLAKFFHKSASLMPSEISSIIVPSRDICFTNEDVDIYSVLYNTSSSLISPERYENLNEASWLSETKNKLLAKLKLETLPEVCNEFRCSMTLNQKAFTSEPELHFRFIASASSVDNIYYLNLPYFTVVQAATEALPEKLIDIK